MPDTEQNPFVTRYGQSKPQPTQPTPDPSVNPFEARYGKTATSIGVPVSPAPSSNNPFESRYGGRAPDAPQTQDDGHGALYRAADTVLNSHPAEINTGNSIVDKVGNALTSAAEAPTGLARGVVKGALSTAAGLGSIYNRVTGSTQPFNQDNLSQLTGAQSAAEGIGKGAEQFGEFTSGEGAAAKALGTAGKIGASGLISGVQSGGDPIATVFGTALPAFLETPAAKYAGTAISKLLGTTTGAGDASIARAFLNPQSSGLAKVMRGEWNVNDVIEHLQDSITAYRDAASSQYAQQLKQLTSQNIDRWHAKSGQILQSINDRLSTELNKFGAVEGEGLDTKHLTGATEEEVQGLVNTIRNWGNEARDMTPAGLDTLKKKIGEVAGNTGSAFATRLYDTAKKMLNQFVPGYEEMSSNYSNASDLLHSIKRELNISPSGDGNTGAASVKLQSMLKNNGKFRELLVNQLPNGSHLLDQIAGLHLNDVMPKGLMQKLVGAESIHALAFGHLTPHAIAAAPFVSPRVVGEAARVAGRAVQSGAIPVVRRATLASKVAGMLSGPQNN